VRAGEPLCDEFLVAESATASLASPPRQKAPGPGGRHPCCWSPPRQEPPRGRSWCLDRAGPTRIPARAPSAGRPPDACQRRHRRPQPRGGSGHARRRRAHLPALHARGPWPTGGRRRGAAAGSAAPGRATMRDNSMAAVSGSLLHTAPAATLRLTSIFVVQAVRVRRVLRHLPTPDLDHCSRGGTAALPNMVGSPALTAKRRDGLRVQCRSATGAVHGGCR
jgi:hypothetical protein